MKTLKEKIEVMQAALDGKEIEYIYPSLDAQEWHVSVNPLFEWGRKDYRIKPEPMEFWVNVYENDNTGFETEESAKRHGENFSSYVKTIKVQEVIK